MLITSLDYSSFTGRIAIGRLQRGKLISGANISLVKGDKTVLKSKIKELHVFEGLGRKKGFRSFSGRYLCYSWVRRF
jgi:GTP-binding protein